VAATGPAVVPGRGEPVAARPPSARALPSGSRRWSAFGCPCGRARPGERPRGRRGGGAARRAVLRGGGGKGPSGEAVRREEVRSCHLIAAVARGCVRRARPLPATCLAWSGFLAGLAGVA